MKNIIRAILICGALAVQLTLSGCGGGGSGGVSGVTVPATPTSKVAVMNSYSITTDELGLLKADALTTENNNSGGLTLRAADTAKMDGDVNAGDIFRIDITGPITTGNSYDVNSGVNSPCIISFFNGEKSTLLTTASGTITFNSFGKNSGDVVDGEFDVNVEESGNPKSPFHIAGTFHFNLNFNI